MDVMEVAQSIGDWLHHFLYDRNNPNWFGCLWICMSTFWTLKAIKLQSELQRLKENADKEQA